MSYYTYDFLVNYLEDLEHLASQGLDTLNHSTNGTPEFQSKREFEDYISDLKKCIKKDWGYIEESLRIHECSKKQR